MIEEDSDLKEFREAKRIMIEDFDKNHREDIAWDDVNNIELPMHLVKIARNEEAGYMNKRGIWTFVDRSEAFRKTGKAPIGSR